MPWAECHQLSELALILDAVPIGFRNALLRSAIAFEPALDFETSYIVGEVRSLLIDSLAQLFGFRVTIASPANQQIVNAIGDFESCHDPAAVQLAVCDMLECLAATSSNSEE